MLGENTLMRQGSSSLPLQVLVYTNWHFAAFFFLINICLFTYKGSLVIGRVVVTICKTHTPCLQCYTISTAVRFYYPSKYLGWELTTGTLASIIVAPPWHKYNEWFYFLAHSVSLHHHRTNAAALRLQGKQNLADGPACTLTSTGTSNYRPSCVLYWAANLRVSWRNVRLAHLTNMRTSLIDTTFFLFPSFFVTSVLCWSVFASTW